MTTHWNREFRGGESDFRPPYEGFQQPEEIDWARYGPDRPTKVKTSDKLDFCFNNKRHLLYVRCVIGLIIQFRRKQQAS